MVFPGRNLLPAADRRQQGDFRASRNHRAVVGEFVVDGERRFLHQTRQLRIPPHQFRRAFAQPSPARALRSRCDPRRSDPEHAQRAARSSQHQFTNGFPQAIRDFRDQTVGQGQVLHRDAASVCRRRLPSAFGNCCTRLSRRDSAAGAVPSASAAPACRESLVVGRLHAEGARHAGTTDVDRVQSQLRDQRQQVGPGDRAVDRLDMAWHMMADADVQRAEVGAQAALADAVARGTPSTRRYCSATARASSSD